MRIAMMTNTYLPIVGGVARSVDTFTGALRKRGHRVLVVAPSAGGEEDDRADVVRVPAIQHFNGSDFSLSVPLQPLILNRLHDFQPELIHAHHPFLLGDSALRAAAVLDVPVVFTYHTMYEHYTHYVPSESETLKELAVNLAVGFCNLADRVIAPSESVRRLLRERNVASPIEVVPTGVDAARFKIGDRGRGRKRLNLPEGAFVVGHLGRLAPEKNCEFLARAMAAFVAAGPNRYALFVGHGSATDKIRAAFPRKGMRDRLRIRGTLQGDALVEAYHAMDAFAFASKTETQGMVLCEAMAAGAPVVALDAPGSREVLEDRVNGRLLPREDEGAFAGALEWLQRLEPDRREAMRKACHETAARFGVDVCTEALIEVYGNALDQGRGKAEPDRTSWDAVLDGIREEWAIWKHRVTVLSDTLGSGQ
jgi:1,2-diacylglycerol 3-alpha-glucosyltransferase